MVKFYNIFDAPNLDLKHEKASFPKLWIIKNRNHLSRNGEMNSIMIQRSSYVSSRWLEPYAGQERAKNHDIPLLIWLQVLPFSMSFAE